MYVCLCVCLCDDCHASTKQEGTPNQAPITNAHLHPSKRRAIAAVVAITAERTWTHSNTLISTFLSIIVHVVHFSISPSDSPCSQMSTRQEHADDHHRFCSNIFGSLGKNGQLFPIFTKKLAPSFSAEFYLSIRF